MKDIIEFFNIKKHSKNITESFWIYEWFRGIVEEELNLTFTSSGITVDDKRLRKIGVYHLYKDGEIVYIGMSVNLMIRLGKHYRDKEIDFDRIDFYEINGVDKKGLRSIEGRMIKRFNPIYNIQNNPQKKARQWTSELRFN